MTLTFLAAMAPATIWLWYFYRKDKRPEPIGLVAFAFFGGIAVVYPVCLIQKSLLPIFPPLNPDQDFDKLFLTMTIVAGVVEEMAKFGIVLLLFVTRHEFDEPVDGLVYAVAVAMGFTAGEDFLRHMSGLEFARLFNPPGHAMFAAFWGFGLGLFMVNHRIEPLIARLAFAAVVHGLWDALAVCREAPQGHYWAPAVIFMLAFGLFWALETKLHMLQAQYDSNQAARRLARAQRAITSATADRRSRLRRTLPS